MLRDVRLAASGTTEDAVYEPPNKELSLTVIGGNAFLTLHRRDPVADIDVEDECSFQVSARSLLLALRAAWDDDRASGAWTDDPPVPTQREPHRPEAAPIDKPAMSHKQWTDEMDAGLREIWGAAERDADPAKLIDAIARSLDRSENAIYSRLVRLKCDPETPGARSVTAPGEDPENERYM